jgi:hypothetical protein
MKTKSKIKTLIIPEVEVDYMVNDKYVNITRSEAKDVIKSYYNSMLKRKGYKNFNLTFG